MDKPQSMSVKDYIMRVQSVRTNTPLKIIEAVVDFQFEDANKALSLPNVHSIEISGFAKFSFNMKKATLYYIPIPGKLDYIGLSTQNPSTQPQSYTPFKAKAIGIK